MCPGFTADSHPAAGGTVACADRVVYIDLLTTKRKPGGIKCGENSGKLRIFSRSKVSPLNSIDKKLLKYIFAMVKRVE